MIAPQQYVTGPTNPQQPVRVATNQLPTPTGRAAPAPSAVPLGNEMERLARQVATAAQQLLTGVQRVPDAPADAQATVEELFSGLGRQVQTVRSDVAHAAQLNAALPLLILAVGIVVRRPLVGAAVAGAFYLWQRRDEAPAVLAS